MINLAYLLTVQSVSVIALLFPLFKAAIDLDHVICCKTGHWIIDHYLFFAFLIIPISSTMTYIASICDDSKSGRLFFPVQDYCYTI